MDAFEIRTNLCKFVNNELRVHRKSLIIVITIILMSPLHHIHVNLLG